MTTPVSSQSHDPHMRHCLKNTRARSVSTSNSPG
jgi:hypothetical protein